MIGHEVMRNLLVELRPMEKTESRRLQEAALNDVAVGR